MSKLTSGMIMIIIALFIINSVILVIPKRDKERKKQRKKERETSNTNSNSYSRES